MMGRERSGLALASTPPTVVMMVGSKELERQRPAASSGAISRHKENGSSWSRRILVVRQPATSWRVWGATSISMSIESHR